MKRLFALVFATVTLATVPQRDPTPPAPDAPRVEAVGIFDRLRARRNPAQLPAAWFVADPQEQPAPAPPKPMPAGPSNGRGYKAPTPAQRAAAYAKAKAANGNRLAALRKLQALPSAFDARVNGWAMPVGDQGNCGSCYLYSTCLTASAAYRKAGYKDFSISIQYGMDCHNFGGCDGGWGLEVIDWMVKNGFPAENKYPPYEARERACRKVDGTEYFKPLGYGFCTGDQSDRQPTTEEIKTALFNYGTLNVALDAGGQFSDGGQGTITAMGNNIDHEINVVAWDDARDGGAFLLQNQWNEFWGNKGYRWVTYKAAARIVDWFWVTATPVTPPDPGPPDPIPPDPTPGKVTIELTPAQVQSVVDQAGGGLTAANRAKLTQSRNLIDEVLGTPPEPLDRVPILAPERWVKDAKVIDTLARAMKEKGGDAEYKKLAGNAEAHPVLMRALWRKMRADADGRLVLAKYMASGDGAEAPAGTLTDLLDWLLKNAPQIIALIVQIIALFG